MKRWSAPLLVLVGLSIAAAPPAVPHPVGDGSDTDAEPAATSMFLRIEGVDGGSTDSRHRGWIEVSSAQWAIEGAASTTVGVRTSPATFSGLAVSKAADASSPALYVASAGGRTFDEATLVVYRPTETARPFYEITLRRVVIAAVEVSSGDVAGDLREKVTLGFSRIEWTYTPPGSGRPVTAGWDVETGRQL